ncbi:MAG TPA: hypothetical protein VFP99_04800 [Chthoniobacterales bacterium]|nr:hypothetical protein [Chthoniobacterales bacterium]
MNSLPKLWIVAERAVRLPNALIAAESLRDRFPGGIHFVRDQSEAWQRVQWQPYSGYFDDVHTFARVKSCRGLRDLPRLYRNTLERKRAVAALPIEPENDLLLCIAGVMGLASVAASAHPKVSKVLSISVATHERLTRAPDRTRFRFTTSGWLQNRVVEPLVGVERTLNLKPRVDPGGDGTRLVRLKKDPDEIFDTIVVPSINGRDLPASGTARFVAARYPSIAELPGFSRSTIGASSGRVLFFGTPFLLVRNLSPEIYVQHANQCLDYLRRNYPGRDLIYRPHPFETKEADQLNLNGFHVESDREAAELYFLNRFAEIEAVFSVSSSVSRRALTFGLNAYAFWRCFPFPGPAARFFEIMMSDVPPEFEIRDLAQPPLAYQSTRTIDPGTRSYGEALSVAANARTALARP